MKQTVRLNSTVPVVFVPQAYQLDRWTIYDRVAASAQVRVGAVMVVLALLQPEPNSLELQITNRKQFVDSNTIS